MTAISIRDKKNYSVGLDIFLPFILYSKQTNTYDDCVLCDIRYLPIREKTFEVVLCIDVIGYLSKNDGFQLIQDLERIARTQVIISAPIDVRVHRHYFPYFSIVWGSQKPKSVWVTSEFKKLGYKVRGDIGPFLLPLDLAYILSFFLPLTYFAPNSSYHMICIKETGVLQAVNEAALC